jgi:hypothetical protein
MEAIVECHGISSSEREHYRIGSMMLSPKLQGLRAPMLQAGVLSNIG